MDEGYAKKRLEEVHNYFIYFLSLLYMYITWLWHIFASSETSICTVFRIHQVSVIFLSIIFQWLWMNELNFWMIILSIEFMCVWIWLNASKIFLVLDGTVLNVYLTLVFFKHHHFSNGIVATSKDFLFVSNSGLSQLFVNPSGYFHHVVTVKSNKTYFGTPDATWYSGYETYMTFYQSNSW